jgi:hypothetical protein
VLASVSISSMSKPAQAASLLVDTCLEGGEPAMQIVHGSRISENTTNSGPVQRTTRVSSVSTAFSGSGAGAPSRRSC